MSTSMTDPADSWADNPFAETAQQPEFWSDVHCLAAEQLAFAINSTNPITVFSGKAGTGKSLVVRSVYEELSDTHLLGFLGDPRSLDRTPCRTILEAFGADLPVAEEDVPIGVLTNSLIAAREGFGLPTLIIDQADQMSDSALINLFDISGVCGQVGSIPFKLVLVGRKVLTDTLERLHLAPAGPSICLSSLSASDTKDYICHRLACAGYKSMVFSEDALALIAKYSGGIPKIIDAVCCSALQEFKGTERQLIESSLVRKSFVLAKVL